MNHMKDIFQVELIKKNNNKKIKWNFYYKDNQIGKCLI